MIKPAVLHIISRPNIGGVQKLLLWLLTSKSLSQYSSAVVALSHSYDDMVNLYKENGIQFESCALPENYKHLTPSFTLNKYLWKTIRLTLFKRAIRKIKPDIVHFQQTHDIPIIDQIKIVNGLKIPWVLTLHGVHHSSNLHQPLKIIESINNSDCMLTSVSQAAMIQSEFTHNIKEEKKRVIYNGIRVNDYRNYVCESWRTRLEIPQTAIVFGSAGSFIEIKGFDIFIEAAAKIIPKNRDVHFVLVGRGPLEKELKNIVKSMGLETNFHILPFQNEIRIFLDAIDVFVLSSRVEGFSMILLEACAMEKPCIATSVGGVPEVLADKGLFVAPDSSDELANAMMTMLDLGIRQEYSRKAGKNAERFEIEMISGQYAEVYRGLLDK
jgi:glycosyltransferase involved in cell wall biosynthesis